MYENPFFVEKSVKVKSKDSLPVPKEDLKKIPHNYEEKGLMELISKDYYLKESHGDLNMNKFS